METLIDGNSGQQMMRSKELQEAVRCGASVEVSDDLFCSESRVASSHPEEQLHPSFGNSVLILTQKRDDALEPLRAEHLPVVMWTRLRTWFHLTGSEDKIETNRVYVLPACDGLVAGDIPSRHCDTASCSKV